MDCNYKLQILESMVYTKSSLLFIQTYSFVGIKEKNKEKEKKAEREKEKRKKGRF